MFAETIVGMGVVEPEQGLITIDQYLDCPSSSRELSIAYTGND